MKMYYCTRYLHNPDIETQYYLGCGQWSTLQLQHGLSNARIALRLYTDETVAEQVIKDLTEGDWHEIEIADKG